MSIMPPSTKRVELHTNKKINEKIKQKTIQNINKYSNSDVNVLTIRLKELNHEWDTERVLEANAASIILISSIIGYFKSPYWFIITGIISFFLLQHALQGWCPPLPIIRRLGVRTSIEINEEKVAIKYLRGDFSQMNYDALNIINVLKRD